MEESSATRLHDWSAGKTPGPWRVTIFPTFRCNLRCEICGGRYVEYPKEMYDELTNERWFRLVDEAADLGVREWLFSGGGEPLLRDDLVLGMCERIRGRGMNGVLQTNGTRLTEGHIESLVEMGWECVGFSLDGPTADIHNAIRGEGAFEKTTSAIRHLRESRRSQGTESPSIYIVSVVTALGYDKAIELVELANELGAWGLEFLDIIVFDAEKMRDLALTPAQKAQLPQIHSEAKRRAEALGLELRTFLDEHAETPRPAVAAPPPAGERLELHEDAHCFDPWSELVILSNGVVSPCCIFWEPDADSVRDTPLEDVWLGPYMQEMRQRLLRGPLPWGCARCPESLLTKHNGAKEEFQRVEDARQRFTLSPSRLASGLVSNLQRHGIRTTVRRGAEWVTLYRKNKGSDG